VRNRVFIRHDELDKRIAQNINTAKVGCVTAIVHTSSSKRPAMTGTFLSGMSPRLPAGEDTNDSARTRMASRLFTASVDHDPQGSEFSVRLIGGREY